MKTFHTPRGSVAPLRIRPCRWESACPGQPMGGEVAAGEAAVAAASSPPDACHSIARGCNALLSRRLAAPLLGPLWWPLCRFGRRRLLDDGATLVSSGSERGRDLVQPLPNLEFQSDDCLGLISFNFTNIILNALDAW
jgi:hypothetical protein